ncbi:MAG: DUF2062 domain-containing protein [Bacteroidota bacterium]
MMQGKFEEQFQELKLCILVPTYNNATTLPQVLDELLSYTNQIIVVNDGSTDATEKLLNGYAGRLTVVGYNKNRGKGYALRRGFREAWRLGFTHVLTIDSDGQHKPSDLPKFLEICRQHPEALIMGSRNMDQASVPGKSSFGNKFSNFWFWVETGIKLPDTQTGYRLYPLEKLHNMRFVTRKYEFEIEVIVKAAWKGIPFKAIPVDVYYAPKEIRISHFRPFRDFTRVSILNTFLVLIAFLWARPFAIIRKMNRRNIKRFVHKQLHENNESNAKIALAITLGVFMGIAPVWGYQMLIALALAHLMKLNKVITLVASNISIPPMIPFILYASFKTGELFVNTAPLSLLDPRQLEFNTIKEHLVQYLLGSITFGFVMAILAGIITYFMLLIFRKPAEVKKNYVK